VFAVKYRMLAPFVFVLLLALPLPALAVAQDSVPDGAPDAGVPGDAAVAPAVATRPPFPEWLDGLRAEALQQGISAGTVSAAFDTLEPHEIIVQRDRAQAEFSFTLDAYIRRRVTPLMVRDARRAHARERALVKKVSAAYGVPEQIIISVWALESNLGRFSGVRPAIQALATLAWDGRREAFFRRELLNALAIVDRGDIDLASLKGSWAGAMGQPQFMPSSYLRYAQDFDGDGRKDIWRSRADVFASIAAYLKENGWTTRHRWGREVRLPEDVTRIADAAPLRTEGCAARRGMTVPLPLSAWQKLGVRLSNGRALPAVTMDASLVRGETRHFLVYSNYEALLAYNCAHAYAISVGLLSDRLGP
jgi:membrane-bound lytic murein transglycosylase B